ncbi:MAG: sigma-70 family RNA polymerase sigma factor [Clostridia bacterium]|nr:sigma-70 family RNA polymerase sigma factor [Clostridia bacterium]
MLELCLVLIDNEQDKALFKDLYDEYNGLVFYIANQHLDNHSLAEEATQEAFLYIAKNFESFKGENINLKGYIATVAKGTAISYYRKESRHLYNLNYDDIKNQYDATESLELDALDVVALSQAMEELPENIRNMMELAYVYGMTSAQIGELYKISAGNVRQKISRAKKELIKEMTD